MIKIPFRALDDIDARHVAIMFQIDKAGEVKLQEVYKDKAPRGIYFEK
jgi:demethoxyubiquinone hydroxylase (CLK1/Coq7/Cat5 family)